MCSGTELAALGQGANQAMIGYGQKQAGRAQRCALADAVIVNDGLDRAQLDAAVGRVWDSWL